MGLLNISAEINRHETSAVFDTGAALCCLSASFAQSCDVEVLPGVAHTAGSAKNDVTIRIGLAKELKLGSNTFHNVVFGVLADEDLTFRQIGYRINAIIGFPVISQLGCLRLRSGSIDIVPSTGSGDVDRPDFIVDDQSIIVRVNYEGTDLSFLLDTGSDSTYLTPRCLQRFPALVEKASKSTHSLAGAGGGQEETIYEVPAFSCKIGGSKCFLQKVELHTVAHFANSDVDGVVGQDLLQKNGFGINFRTLQFRLLDTQ